MQEPEVLLRVLTAGESSVLDRVVDDVFDFPIRAELTRSYLQDSRNLLAVAIQDGVVVGMASAIAYEHPDRPLQLFINEVGVTAGNQCQGLGKKLVSLLLERGRAMGCTEAWVATEEENVAARSLYAALRGREDPKRAVVYTFSLSNRTRPVADR